MGFVVKAVKKVVKTVVGVVSKVIGGVFGFAIGGKSSKAKAVNTLNKSLEPESYRKIVLGKIASPLDVRYWEVWGTKGQNFDEIVALAGHKVNAVLDLYFEEKLAFSGASTSPTTAYTGIVSRVIKLGADNQTGFTAGGGARWSIASTFDGCAYIKLAWIPDEKKLPNGIPNTYRQVVEGALVYDPRRDSTRGGSGTHRADDRSTWSYATLDSNGQPIGRNNALQALWYLLGWTVPTKNAGGTVTGERLVCGRGVDPEDINFATFIAGANACETAGYYTDVVLSTEEAHTSNEDKITCNGLIGRLIDPGGLWSYYANVDDTASIAVDLTDADILQGDTVSWNEYKGMSDQFNQVRGKFVYPASPVLYQAYPYPMVRDATYETNLGTKRAKPLDFEQVLDSTLAQRLARLFLNEGQYQGEFKASFNYKALRAQAWSVVRYTSDRFGFVKLFRVYRQDISTDSGVGMLLKEIHSSIWSAGTVTAPMAPGLGLAYEATQEIAATGVTKTLINFDAPDGTKGDGFFISWTAPPNAVRRTEIHYRLQGTTSWTTEGPVERDILGVKIGPVFSGAVYEAEVRHISINEIAGPWVAVTGGAFNNGTYGNVNYAAIAAAGGTAVWAGITGTGKPSDNAGTSGILTPIGTNQAVQGNTTYKPTGTHGTSQGGVVGMPQVGSAFISSSTYTMRGGGWAHFLALDDDATSFGYITMNYGMNLFSGTAGTLSIDFYVNGMYAGNKTLAGCTANTRVALTYDGQRVIGLVDGVDCGVSIDAPAGLKLYPKLLESYVNAAGTAGNIQDVIYGTYQNNTASGVTLYDRHGGTYSIVGNSIQKLPTAAAAWDYSVFSREAMTGNAVVTGQLNTANAFLGLTINTTDISYTGITYGAHSSITGNWYIYSEGAEILTMGTAYNGVTFSANTVWSISYDGTKWRTHADGVLMHTYATAANLKVYAAVAMGAPNAKVSDIAFGSYTSNVWADIDGNGVPENYATTGQNLIYNGNAELGTTDGWLIDAANGTGPSFVASSSLASNGKYGFFGSKGTGGDQFHVIGRAMPVKPGRRYLIKLNANGSAGTASGMYIRMNEKNVPPTDGVFVRGSELTSVGYMEGFVAENMPWAGAQTDYSFFYTPTAGITFASPLLINYLTGPAQFRFDDFTMTEVVEWSIGVGGTGKPEDNADVTYAVLAPMAIYDVQASSTGIVESGELPRDLVFKMKKGAASDVTTSSTWSVSVISGSTTCTIGATTGVLNITAVGATSVLEIVATYGIYIRSVRITINLILALPDTSGGSSGGTTAITTSHSACNSSSYSTSASGIITVKTGTSGQAALTCAIQFQRGTTTLGGSSLYGKWQWRAVGGSFADVATEVLCSTAATTTEDYPTVYQSKGVLNFSNTKTGLTANTNYEFRLIYRNAVGTVNHYITGTGTGAGS